MVFKVEIITSIEASLMSGSLRRTYEFSIMRENRRWSRERKCMCWSNTCANWWKGPFNLGKHHTTFSVPQGQNEDRERVDSLGMRGGMNRESVDSPKSPISSWKEELDFTFAILC